MKQLVRSTLSIALFFIAAGIGAVWGIGSQPTNDSDSPTIEAAQQVQQATPTLAAIETIPPYTPLPSFTPSQTLKPPPTFEPPTTTPVPSQTPTTTPTATTYLEVSLPGYYGAETPTPTSTAECKPREDWALIYTVQRDDALATIAAKYNTTMFDLAKGNCLVDMNLIVIGQQLRVPGAAHPVQAEVECIPYEVLTPINGAVTIEGDGNITFNWRGPLSPLSLIRVYRPDGTVFERLVELRQNETVNMSAELRPGGTYTWYVYPLGRDYLQIACHEGGPWTFTKEAAK